MRVCSRLVGACVVLLLGAASARAQGIAARFDASGNLLVSAAGSTADNATVTESTSPFNPIGGEFLTTPGTVTTGHQAMVAITAHRAFQVTFFDAAGNAMLGSKTSANSLPVVVASDQGAIPVSQSGTWTGGTNLADRATFTYGTTPFNPFGGVYNTSITALTSGQAGAAALTPTRDVHTALYDANGTALGGQKNMAGSIPVVLPSDQFVADTNGTLQSAAVANGNGSTLSTSGLSAAMVTVNCSGCSGGTTINFEGTEDSTNYAALQAQQLGTNTIATTTTTSGITEWQIPVGGVQNIRARVSSYSAGTVTITGHATSADYAPKAVNANVVSVPSNQSVSLAQINGSTIATAATGIAKVGVTDGTGNAVTSTAGALDINIKSGGGSGGTALADAATFTQATTSFTPFGGIFTNSVTNLTSGQAGVAQLTNDRMLYTNLGKVGGTAVDTNSGNKSAGTQRFVLATDQPNLTTPLNVAAQPAAVASGGATPAYYISAASNNSTNKKASAGTVYSILVVNTTATLKYLRLYDSASAPTCTANTGAVFYTPIPANSTTGAGFSAAFPVGAAFASGIGWCITGGAGDTDNTSTAAGDVILNLSYK